METFREDYIRRCTELNIEPSYTILDKLRIETTKEDGKVVYPETLDLSGQNLSLKGVTALASALQNDVVFTRLNLSDAFLSDDGTIVIANALKTNNTLKHLDLRGNNIRNDGAIALGQLLKINSTLTHLNLEWNCIGIWDEGIKSIADGLAVNSTLEEIDLRNNKIGPHGVQALALSIKHNTVLQKMDLRWNNSGIMGGRAFVDALKWNTVLLDIELAGNEVPEDVVRSIDAALARNRSNHLNSIHNKVRDTHLNAALQALTKQHQETLSTLQTKLSTTDSQAMELSHKLTKASTEISQTHESYKILELQVERLSREKQLVEDLLLRERKDFGEKVTELETVADRERERRKQLEESHRGIVAEITKKSLEMEAGLRDAEVKVEVLRREKKSLTEELDKTSRALDEKLTSAEHSTQRKLTSLEDAKNREIAQLEGKIRVLESQKTKFEEEIDAQRAKHLSQKRDWETQVTELERRIHHEEETRRKDITQQLQTLEAKYVNLSASHQAALLDHERQLSLALESKNSLMSENSNLKMEKTNLTSQVTNLLTKLDDTERRLERETASSAKLNVEVEKMKKDLSGREERTKQLEGLIQKLKTEIRFYKEEMDVQREEELLKMKELENAIENVVRHRQKEREKRLHDLEKEVSHMAI